MMQKAYHQFNDTKQILITAVKSKDYLLLIYQNSDVSNTEYLQCLKAPVNIVHAGVGKSGHHTGLKEDNLEEIIAKAGTSTALDNQKKEAGKIHR